MAANVTPMYPLFIRDHKDASPQYRAVSLWRGAVADSLADAARLSVDRATRDAAIDALTRLAGSASSTLHVDGFTLDAIVRAASRLAVSLDDGVPYADIAAYADWAPRDDG